MLTHAFVVTLLQTVKFNGICILSVILTCLECILCRGKLKLLHVHVFTMYSADFFWMLTLMIFFNGMFVRVFFTENSEVN